MTIFMKTLFCSLNYCYTLFKTKKFHSMAFLFLNGESGSATIITDKDSHCKVIMDPDLAKHFSPSGSVSTTLH